MTFLTTVAKVTRELSGKFFTPDHMLLIPCKRLNKTFAQLLSKHSTNCMKNTGFGEWFANKVYLMANVNSNLRDLEDQPSAGHCCDLNLHFNSFAFSVKAS